VTIDEMNQLPEVAPTPGLKWREEADPLGYMDADGVKWEVSRAKDGTLVRSRAAPSWMSGAFAIMQGRG